jgi:hypothetical protein
MDSYGRQLSVRSAPKILLTSFASRAQYAAYKYQAG